jgi:hypothetical protein
VDDLKEIAKVLRAMPVVHPRTPTLCLVGAPNVGKSSLVRIISSGKPEVCNYPFTTRGISMGHFFVENQRFQVTDTPGLLRRSDGNICLCRSSTIHYFCYTLLLTFCILIAWFKVSHVEGHGSWYFKSQVCSILVLVSISIWYDCCRKSSFKKCL